MSGHGLVAAALLLTLLHVGGCNRAHNERDWSADLQQIERKYAPDRRLAVFRVNVSNEAGRLLATGEVDNPAAKGEVLDRLQSAGPAPVADHITVLPERARLSGKDYGIVNVAVGNMRSQPEHSAEMVTQVLLGQTVRILKADSGWFYVQSPDGYLGWIDHDAVVQTDQDGGKRWDASDRLIVTSANAVLREGTAQQSLPVSDLALGNIVSRTSTRGSPVEVRLPDGRAGFVERDDVQDYRQWLASRKATPEAIEHTARRFLGVPYLWGGTSVRGFDCSGFVKTVFMLNGIDLLRDADQQARAGIDIQPGPAFANLKRGDLLFFGRKQTPQKPERIWHVAIYLSDRNFIHCSGRVRVGSLDPASAQYDEGHVRYFLRARRLIGTPAAP